MTGDTPGINVVGRRASLISYQPPSHFYKGGYKMKLNDIIALAKAGYKASDIKELISLESESRTSGVEEPAETEPKEAPQPEPEKTEEKPAAAETSETDKIKELEAQLAQVRKDLEKAQTKNTTRDNSSTAGSPDPQVVLNEIARKFM